MGDYQPYDHREVELPLTDWEAFVSLIKCCIGTGVLAMPRAFYNVGGVAGFIYTILIGTIVVYALHMLIGGIYELCVRLQTPLLTYKQAMTVGLLEGPDICHCFHGALGIFVDIILSLYHFGIMCIYVVFMATNIKPKVDEYITVLDARIIMMILTIPLVCIFLIKHIKNLYWPSLLGNILLFLGFFVIFYFVFTALPPVSEIKVAKGLAHFYLYFGTVLFAIEAVGVIVIISESMQKPQHFLGTFGVLNLGMFVVVALYAFIGFIGYWRYGEKIKDTITLNLPKNTFITEFVALAIFCTYPLQGFVTIDIIWRHNIKNYFPDANDNWEYILRTIVAMLSVLVAAIFNDLEGAISLIGSFCLSFVGLIFPAILDLCVRYKNGYGFCKIHLFKDFFIMIIGLCGVTIGTYISLKDLLSNDK